ncbi:MAG: carboxypeptidase regulatory-like domain-containing protein, partial [Gemmatimonadales bacterium]
DDPTSALPLDPPPPVGDVIGYRVYRVTDPDSFIDPENPAPTLVELANETGTGAIPPALGGQLGAGDALLTDSTAVLGETYYYLVRAVDRTQTSINDGAVGPCTATDTQPPSFDNFDPANASTGVPISTDITFQVHDPGNGVDQSTLIMMLDVGGTPEGPFAQTDFTITQLVPGSDTDLEVVFDRPSPLPTSTVVTVELWAMDKGLPPNGSAPPAPAMATFSFTTEATQTIDGNIQLTTDGTTPLLLALDVTINVTGPAGPLPPIVVTTSATTGATTYTIPAVTGGDYDITPVLSGTTWSPVPPVTVNVPPSPSSGSVTGPDFTGTVTTFTLAGTVEDHVGNPAPGVTITVATTDGTPSAPATTAGDGSYSIGPVLQGTYTLTPSLATFTFTPVDQTVTAGVDPTSNIDFLILFSVSGHIERSDTSADLPGVVVSAGGQQDTTDASGNYTITDVPASAALSIVPSLANFTFTPVSYTEPLDVTTGNLAPRDFTASPVLYSISGTVTAATAGGLSGLTITVSATGGPSSPPPAAVNPTTGAYTITGLEAGTYTVTPSEAAGGAQFSPASENVTLPPTQTGVNFTAYRIFQVVPANDGLQMVAAPFTPMPSVPELNVSDVFGTVSVARWNPQGIPAQYVMFSIDPTNPVLRVEPGRGFWASVAAPLPQVPGTPAPTDRAFTIPIYSEWTMAGNPWPASVSWSSVQQSTTALSDLAWVYVNNGTGAGYVLVTDTISFNTRSAIEPFEAFWQHVALGTVGASISVPVPAGVLSRGAADAPPAEGSAKPRSLVEDGWLLPVVASTAETRDACNYVGVGAPARGVVSTLKIDNPPPATEYADVYFDGAAQGEPGRRLATDIRAADAAELQFDFVVATDLAQTDITVSLPDLSQLTKHRQVVLTDLDAGETVLARTKPTYRYNSGDGGERHFRIDVRDAAHAGLQVVGLHAIPTRGAAGAGAEVRYSLTGPATVTTQIYNVSGRLVARVESATTRSTGAATALWDGRGLTGTVVPNGLYFVRVTATGQQGAKAGSAASVSIRR